MSSGLIPIAPSHPSSPSPNPLHLNFLYSLTYHYTIPVALLNRAIDRGLGFTMSFSASSPKVSLPSSPSPPIELPQNTPHHEHSYSLGTMSSYCYPSSRFDFTTASVAIARERAGSRSRPAPRSHRPPHAEDRPDPSVSKEHPRACHSPVALDRVSWFSVIFLRVSPFTCTNILTFASQIRGHPPRPRREQDRRRGRHP